MTHKQKTRQLRKHPNRSQRGQILIIVVFAIIGLVAFVGLVVDTGLVFIGNGRLRRAVDAAALAAASEYRKDPNPSELKQDAVNFLVLNNVEDPSAEVHVCNPNPIFIDYNDPTLCTSPARRRLVRVDATSSVHLAFLPVIGIRTVSLNATATSEAASLDIVFAMDVSESMTWDEAPGSLMRDPAECNDVPSVTDLTNCHPFRDIQQAAMQFVQGLFPVDGSNEYDRVSVIPFDREAHHSISGFYNDPLFLGDQAPYLASGNFTGYRQTILNELAGLRVFNASGSSASGGPHTDGTCLNSLGALVYTGNVPCRQYSDNEAQWDRGGGNWDFCFEHPITDPPIPMGLSQVPPDEAVFGHKECFTDTPTGSPHLGPFIRPSDGEHFERSFIQFNCPDTVIYAECPGTTNTGGAFRAAGAEFTRTPGFRQESLWVVIMLTDGEADHASDIDGHGVYCPQVDGITCQDSAVKTYDSGTRHCLLAGNSLYTGLSVLHDTCMSMPPGGTAGFEDEAAYDADDYARDMADFVALGQQALVYTIGFGNYLGHTAGETSPNLSSPGEMLLNYAADIGDDGKIDTPNNQFNSDYFYAHDASSLNQIFQTISDRISTRLTH
jgi:hypothetical protein